MENPFSFKWDESQQRCLRLRKRILDMSQRVSALHIAGAFSCLEMVEVIYFHLMEQGDSFIMSKGHGCLSQYTSLEEKGILSTQDLDNYCQVGGILGTHPDYGNPGIEASTGSLGHGLGLAVGMAYADQKIHKKNSFLFVVMSDGELQEGSVWEAILMAPALGVRNLLVFVDLNDFQSLGRMSETHPNMYPIPEKIKSFGWDTFQVNGHNTLEIFNTVKRRNITKPLMVLGETTKGKGVSYMENVPIWHYRSPSPTEYLQALSELKEIRG